MTDSRLLRRAALLGGLATVFFVAEIPLYFIYSGPPPDGVILVRILLNLLGVAALIPFLAALGQLIHRLDAAIDWVTATMIVAGAIWLTLSLVAQSTECGTAIVTVARIDPTTDGVLTPGQFLMQGAMSRVLCAVLLLAAGHALRRTRLLPGWVGLSAYAVALLNLAFVPAMFFGHVAAHFYSAQGWGTTATASGFVIAWFGALSLALWRAGR
jgi:hypothetical protein